MKLFFIIFGSCVMFIILVLTLMVGLPLYSVWQQEKAGKAIFAKAEYSRKVLISQAEAEKDAASLRAQAINIVGKAAKEFPEYRQQEFIGAFAYALEHGNIHQIIYVPTEAGIPIIEASRLGQ